MNDDVKGYIYGAVIVFLIGVGAWVGFLFVNACGFSLRCDRADRLALPETTPVPTLIPATLPASMGMDSAPAAASDVCSVAASDLIGAWVEAGSPETEAFEFTDANGATCESTFEEVLPLFTKSNLWYSGSLSCISCHSVDLTISPAQLDLSSYEGILAGSRRAEDAAQGTDILGGGNWESSLLYQFIAESKDVPGHDAGLSSGLVINAGAGSASRRTPRTAASSPSTSTTFPGGRCSSATPLAGGVRSSFPGATTRGESSSRCRRVDSTFGSAGRKRRRAAAGTWRPPSESS